MPLGLAEHQERRVDVLELHARVRRVPARNEHDQLAAKGGVFLKCRTFGPVSHEPEGRIPPRHRH